MKTYQFRLYSKSGSFKKQINPTNVSSDVDFQEELDGGQGDMTLQVVDSVTDYSESDIVEIREVDDDAKTASPTYTGIIEEIGIDEYPYSTVLSLKLLGVFTALNDMLYKSGGARAFSKNMTAGNMLKDVLADFNSQYGTLVGETENLVTTLIREGTIDVTGATLNISFDNENHISAINKILEGTGKHYFIGANGVMDVFVTWTAKTLTFGNEITAISRKKHKRDMVNLYRLVRNGGTELSYTDPASVTAYGTKESRDTDSEILDATTQNAKWNGKIADFAYPRNEISMQAKKAQSDSVTPWMALTVQNTAIPIVSQPITKMRKGTDWTIYVGDFVSFGETAKNR